MEWRRSACNCCCKAVSPPGKTGAVTPGSAVLWQRDLINYFAEETRTLPPAVAHQPLFEKIRTGIGSIRTLLNHAPDKLSLADVKTLHAQARELNLAIAAAD